MPRPRSERDVWKEELAPLPDQIRGAPAPASSHANRRQGAARTCDGGFGGTSYDTLAARPATTDSGSRPQSSLTSPISQEEEYGY